MGGTMKNFLALFSLSGVLAGALFVLVSDTAHAEVITHTPQEAGTIGYTAIRAPFYFWGLVPWRDGKLATRDGRARFAEISFTGRNGIGLSIRPLINFPMQPVDRHLSTAPEAGVIVTKSGDLYHVADIDSKKSKTYYFDGKSWWFVASLSYIMDTTKGLVNFIHRTNNVPEKLYYNIIYDPKNDVMVYQTPQGGEPIGLFYGFTPELFLGQHWIDNTTSEMVLYNWRTRSIVRNKLTDMLTTVKNTAMPTPYRNFHPQDRYLFAKTPIPEDKWIKITWDEDIERIALIPLDYLLPRGKEFAFDFVISADGKWATNFLRGYEGLFGENLYKRVFFHLDGRYPNGISMPILADAYYENPVSYDSFVEHPVFGWCLAEEWNNKEGGKEGLYLRLYKMSDVQEEINRQLLAKAKDVLH
jgi:hypothetical protein